MRVSQTLLGAFIGGLVGCTRGFSNSWAGAGRLAAPRGLGQAPAAAAGISLARRPTARRACLGMQFDREQERSQKMRLREEAESPFRKVRLFTFGSFAVSATVGLLIAVLRVLALSRGIDQGQSFEELGGNIAIDLGAIGVSAFLIRNDLAAQKGRLARMEIGAKLASLRVRLQLEDDNSTVALSALRRDRGRDKRVAVIAGGKDVVSASLDSALPYAEALGGSDILIIPLILEERPGPGAGAVGGGESDAAPQTVYRAAGGEGDLPSAVGQAHVALPVVPSQWQGYIDTEVETAVGQGIDPVKDGFCLILKKNGRIGQRAKGCPPWGVLVGDVENRKAAGMDVTNI